MKYLQHASDKRQLGLNTMFEHFQIRESNVIQVFQDKYNKDLMFWVDYVHFFFSKTSPGKKRRMFITRLKKQRNLSHSPQPKSRKMDYDPICSTEHRLCAQQRLMYACHQKTRTSANWTSSMSDP